MYEIARESGISSKELLKRLTTLGIEASSHMTALEPEHVQRINEVLTEQRRAASQQGTPPVLRRRRRRPARQRPEERSGERSAERGTETRSAPEGRREAPPRDARPERPEREQRRQPQREYGQWASLSARERFERELEEARRRTEERRVSEETTQKQAVNAPARAPGRPAVGDVIALPSRSPIGIRGRERGRPAGAPARPGAPSARSARPGAPSERPGERPGERSGASAMRPGSPSARPGAAPGSDRSPAPARPTYPRVTVRPGPGPGTGPGGRSGGRPGAGPGTRPGARPDYRRPGGFGGIRGGPRGARGRKGQQGPARPPSTRPAAEHKRVVKIHDSVAVAELARSMGVKATEVLKKLWGMGMMGVTINAAIDADAAGAVASEFGYEVKNVAFQEEAALELAADRPEALVPRAPVVTVMGHVDHGKTTLLDAIRATRVAAGEAGGITQHIAAYRVKAPSVGKVGEVVFLDTPGHEAFTAMRARGAQATDIVVLVVAANDGVMPQTIEALDHARDAKVPVVVAVNKIDAPNAHPERVRQQLADRGLIPEEWGGDTLYVEVSALQRLGIDDLLASLALQADLLALEANPDKPAVGVVIEARLDRARGPLATVLVRQGTLRVGDTIVAGEHSGKVRALLDEQGATVDAAGPSVPVQVLGLDGVPEPGEVVNATDEKTARQLVEHRVQDKRKRQLATLGKVSLESMMSRLQGGEALELKIVLKTDVHGSAEALEQALARLSTAKVSVNVIHTGVGGVTESDVNLAKAGGAIIVGFNVRPAGKAASVARREGVEIRLYDVIYDALDDVKAAMAGLLPPVRREHALGQAAVRDVFRITGVGLVAGCMVSAGTVRRGARARLIRNAVQVHEGVISDLKRFKEDVAEVHQGYECGMRIDGTNDVRVGDVIEAYQVVEEPQTL